MAKFKNPDASKDFIFIDVMNTVTKDIGKLNIDLPYALAIKDMVEKNVSNAISFALKNVL